jgi:signal transduction histidine kinase
MTGQPLHFENFSPALKRHYEIYAYRSAPGHFATLFVDISVRKEAEAAVQAHQTRLRRLASQLSLTEERERRKIAVELHDRIGHNLTLAKMKVEELAAGMPDGIVGARFSGLIDLLETTINSTSSLTFELSSPILYELGLESALQWLAEHTEKQHGINVSFADDGIARVISQDRSVMLFQIAREMVFNVVKHAQATHAAIMVQHGPDGISIHVSDDGRGFEPDEVGPGKNTVGGFGLFSIRERLTSVGGELNIRSGPDSGTHIHVRMPYQ